MNVLLMKMIGCADKNLRDDAQDHLAAYIDGIKKANNNQK